MPSEPRLYFEASFLGCLKGKAKQKHNFGGSPKLNMYVCQNATTSTGSFSWRQGLRLSSCPDPATSWAKQVLSSSSSGPPWPDPKAKSRPRPCQFLGMHRKANGRLLISGILGRLKIRCASVWERSILGVWHGHRQLPMQVRLREDASWQDLPMLTLPPVCTSRCGMDPRGINKSVHRYQNNPRLV